MDSPGERLTKSATNRCVHMAASGQQEAHGQRDAQAEQGHKPQNGGAISNQQGIEAQHAQHTQVFIETLHRH